jgi:LPXTG-motif cell wall-anchored protein
MRGVVAATVAAALAVAMLLTASPAHAATTSRWADWTFGGAAGSYAGTVEIADTPALDATFTSTSRGGGVGVISGASTWLSEGTPVGAKYGSSRDEPYVNLRPRADTQSGASRTTYSFDRPTPTSGWTFVLGDIDADAVSIRAVGPDGVELTAAELGFRGGFNYCAPGVAGKPSCTGAVDDVPTWDAATLTLTGNAAANDTSGAAGWFEPSVPISSLTFDFVRRAGFPVYQTWFASLARDVTGTVADQNTTGPAADVLLRLLDADGRLIAETRSDAAGAFAFPGVTATDGYVVEVVPPAGRTVEGPARTPVDLTTADAVVPFVIRDIVPVPVSGALRATDGTALPIGGVPVTLTEAGGATLSTVTASDGTWFIDDVPVGTWTASIPTPPAGYDVTAPPVFTVPPGSEVPVVDRDFTLVPFPTLSGTVTAEGDGVAGVSVTATGPAGSFGAVTADDGTYAFPRIPAGDYQVEITVPDGYSAIVTEQSVTIVADDETADFVLVPVRSGVVTGSVTADGAPVPGAQLAIVGPGGSVPVFTDEAGGFAVDGIPSGSYELVLTVPDGYQAVGPSSQPFTITVAGETIEAAFTLAAVVAPTPTPSATPGDPGDPSPAPGTLPATGGTVDASLPIAGAGLVLLGAMALAAASVRRSRRLPR